MAEHTQSRRSALKSLAWGVAGLAGLWRFLTPRTIVDAARKRFAVRAADVPADGALVLPEHGVAIVRQGDAILGVGLACTHLGCTVKATAEGFACPCHGSRFGCDGERISGPASHALARVAVEERAGVVLVTPDADGEQGTA